MQITRNKLLVIAGAAIAVAIIALLATKGGGEGTVTTTPLSKIYSQAQIQDKGDYYLVDSKEVYTKTIRVGGENLMLVVEKQEDGGLYRFFTPEPNPRLLKEVLSYIRIAASSDIESNLSMKDITGDGIEEIFIKVEQSSNNLRAYEVLKKEDGSLVNITRENSENNWVDFDEIAREDGYVTMTWHATDARGKTRYKIENDIFVPVQSVGFFQVPIYGEVCEVRTKGTTGDFTVVEKKQSCNIWTENFSPYFTN